MKIWELVLIILGGLLTIFIIFSFFNSSKSPPPGKKLIITNSDGKQISINSEIADDSIKKMKGLMGRKFLGEDEGMLFVFNGPGIYSFWMVNTTIPLDAVFISDRGEIVEIIKMDPCSLTQCLTYTPKNPAKYVLEVNQGFSEKNKIEVGKSKVKIDGVL